MASNQEDEGRLVTVDFYYRRGMTHDTLGGSGGKLLILLRSGELLSVNRVRGDEATSIIWNVLEGVVHT